MKLPHLHEESPEGLMLNKALGLGARIAKALQHQKNNAKKNINPNYMKTLPSRKGQKGLPAVHPHKPRHRKFFGIDHPGRPY